MKDKKTVYIQDYLHSHQISLQTGPFGTQLRASDYSSSGTPVINVRNIGYGRIMPSELEHLNENHALRLEQHILRKGDIVFGRKGAIDRHALITEKETGWIQGSDCIRLRIESPVVNAKYLSYFFQTNAHKNWMQSQGAFAATMSSLNQGKIGRISFPNPPLLTQSKIAAILSAYDDLIEINERRIALLEKMAEEIYREWFVRMRFPGHNDRKSNRALPSGWDIQKAEQAFKFCGGGTPSTNNQNYWLNGSINWYSPTDLTASSSFFSFSSKTKITELGLRESAACLFPAYSIMLSSRATIGMVSINTTPACTNQGFINCIPNQQVPLHYLFFWLRTNKDLFIQHASGSTFLEITKGKFKNLDIVVPSPEIIGIFEDTVSPLFRQIELLTKSVHTLSSTRDRLLTRLMSGALDVEKLDIAFPPSMEEELKAERS